MAVPGDHLLFRERTSRARLARDRAATGAMYVAVALALIPLGLILVYLVIKGRDAMGIAFLTESQPFSFVKKGGGALNALVGTGLMVGLATVASVPIGVLAAVYLTEYGRGWFATVVRFLTDVMTGVPSVFVGLFIFTILIIPKTIGFSAIAGGMALSLIMLPIVIRSTEEILKLVPGTIRDASYALGATRARTIFRVVLPSAAPGIATGVMLAVARAAGETAPLIMTALGSVQLVTHLTEPISALPLYIFQGASTPFIAGQQRAWAASLELVGVVLVFTVLARWVSSRWGER